MDDRVVSGDLTRDPLGLAPELARLFLLDFMRGRGSHKRQLVPKVGRTCIKFVLANHYLRSHQRVESRDGTRRDPLNRLFVGII